MISYLCDTLWSINDRLGGGKGIDMPALGTEWLDDILDMASEEARTIAQPPPTVI